MEILKPFPSHKEKKQKNPTHTKKAKKFSVFGTACGFSTINLLCVVVAESKKLLLSKSLRKR
jgi:hypothetical protein